MTQEKAKNSAKEYFVEWAASEELKIQVSPSVIERMVQGGLDLQLDDLPSEIDDWVDHTLPTGDHKAFRTLMNSRGLGFSSEQYSNHDGIDRHIQNIRSGNAYWLDEKHLENFYLGVIHEGEPYATAVDVSEDFSGRLIVYSIGMLHAVMFMSDVFEHSHMLNSTRQGNENIEYEKKLAFHVLRLFNWWREKANRVSYSETTDLMRDLNIRPGALSLSFADHADKFIAAHEICHHLLGDTGQSLLDDVNDLLPDGLRDHVSRLELSADMKKEILADAGALFLCIGGAVRVFNFRFKTFYPLAVGALATVGTIALLDSESTVMTSEGEMKSEPSLPESYERFQALFQVIRSMIKTNQREDEWEKSSFIDAIEEYEGFVSGLLEIRAELIPQMDAGEI